MPNFITSSIAVKVQLSVQLLLLVVSIVAAMMFYNVERKAMERGAESKIRALADGVINGANMLMLNGIISDVEQRKLFITKMGSGEDIKSLRIIRNKLVQEQFGMGLPEEQPKGKEELQALEDGKVFFEQRGDILHGIVPYTESKNFRGTNCLMCHTVPEGYHNGASVVDLDISANNRELRTVAWVSVGVILGVQVLLWLLFRFILHKFVSDPAGRMRTAIMEISRTGDFTRRVKVDSDDEIGQTVRSFNELMENLQTAFRQVGSDIGKVTDSSHSLSTSSQQVAKSSSSQSEAASAMAATIEEITVSIAHVAEGAREALKISRSSGELSERGGEIIHRAAEEMKKIADTVRQTSVSIGNLGEQSTRISSIVMVIKEIADQTNLLALNAAIEAARAGEQGRGFAVVADEVRKLAERTTKSTQEVTQMIDTIQSASNAAVAGMESTVVQVDGGVSLAQQAGEAINQIKTESSQVLRTVTDISSAIEEQSKASNEIAANIEKVAQMTEHNSTAAEQTADAASHLAELADNMQNTVNRFKV
ncbi:methyl-accepting chemotaxis protein [Sideroxydans lithotrophicus]|uniref:Methyl-accepting chemotaxis sensory transducer n=1 Tax=Sideroxydans lithotrophicus (strain ES-1) TaxID=580332 RepID=D5CMI0_SIDLE|nr:methyl-accepting chemotaxis protein [Sideroxydans lithotrophicus]ADE12652.1 methyl-accepting chemotaxis sensory transducer [Sideroxydans lithotrophicus ES-1]